jgi:Ni/Co efflux regulator RcnB
MKFKSIAAIAAATGALALAGAADAKPKKHDNHTWDARRQVWVANDASWTPPGLAKKPHGMPPGQAKKMGLYNTGQHLPRTYYSNRTHYVTDYNRYNLRVAPPGYQWVRVGNDVYLAQTRTGLIADIVRSIFD